MFYTQSTPTIPISEMRKRFGEIEAALPYLDYILITKKGKPFAKISATDEAKKELLKKSAGSLKGTDLDNDAIWKDVLTKKSRKSRVRL
jgi:hypothetical protein